MCNLPQPRQIWAVSGRQWRLHTPVGYKGVDGQLSENLEMPAFFMAHQYHKHMNKGRQLKHPQSPVLHIKKETGQKERKVL